MATNTTKQKAGLQLGNAIYKTMSADPVAVQNLPAPSADNYAEFMQSIKTYNASYNSFINAVNQIVTIYINGAEDRNPFYEMVKGFINYGDTIEHMFVDTFDVSVRMQTMKPISAVRLLRFIACITLPTSTSA